MRIDTRRWQEGAVLRHRSEHKSDIGLYAPHCAFERVFNSIENAPQELPPDSPFLPPGHSGSERGSLLIIALSFLMIMSLFALSVGYGVRQRLLVASRLEAREKLFYIAEAGVKKAMAVLEQKETRPPVVDALTQSWSRSEAQFKDIPVGEGSFSIVRSSGEDLQYGLVDEESKINLNHITAPAILTRLLQGAAGIEAEKAQGLAFCIMDWIDPDDDPHDLGAEKEYYLTLKPPYAPKNAGVRVFEELLYVKGMNPEILESIRPYVTLEGAGKQINANTASGTVLLSMGLGDSLVSKIMAFRKGRDQAEGTADDSVFGNAGEITETLQSFGYLDASEVEMMNSFSQSGKLGVSSETFTVQSLARLQRRSESLRVLAVVNKVGEIRQWQEEYLKTPS